MKVWMRKFLIRLAMFFVAWCMTIFQLWFITLFLYPTEMSVWVLVVLWLINYIALNFGLSNAHILFD
jgi:hypothetical protein